LKIKEKIGSPRDIWKQFGNTKIRTSKATNPVALEVSPLSLEMI
jgi:hypothetical protein